MRTNHRLVSRLPHILKLLHFSVVAFEGVQPSAMIRILVPLVFEIVWFDKEMKLPKGLRQEPISTPLHS